MLFRTTSLNILLPSAESSGTNEGERFFLDTRVGVVMFSEIMIISSLSCMDLVTFLSSSISGMSLHISQSSLKASDVTL